MGIEFMGIELGSVIEVIAGSAISAVGVYAGVRADLAKIMERATTAKETADRAHARIDTIMGLHK